jgi:5-methylcytosine-specific restriction protein A
MKKAAVCSEPACPNLQPCAEHARSRSGSQDKRYSSRRWRALRARVLGGQPTCARCPRPATDVHHKDGLGFDGPLGWDESNLEGLCRSCHSRETARSTGLGGAPSTAPRPPQRRPYRLGSPRLG